jgi:hypothetical protein
LPPIDHHHTPWELAAGRSLSELLDIADHRTNGGCRWRRGTCPLSDGERLDAAAWLVAKEIMGCAAAEPGRSSMRGSPQP